LRILALMFLIAISPSARGGNRGCDDLNSIAADSQKASVQAIIRLESSCQKRVVAACRELQGLLHSTQLCLDQKNSAAASILDHACDSGSGEACLAIAEHVAARWKQLPGSGSAEARVKEALGSAYPDYLRACTQRHPRGCAYVGWLLRDGIGVRADPARGTRILKRVCDEYRLSPHRVDSSAEACQSLALSYETGVGVHRDRRMARELRHDLCRNMRVGCGDLFLVPWLVPRVLAWILQAAVLLIGNALAVFSLARSGVGAGRLGGRLPVIVLCALASVLSGAELAYYFWGSQWSSGVWLLAAIPPMILPIVAGTRERRRPRYTSP
jgi:hypothetical protein